MLHKVYYPNISKVTELRRFFTKRAFNTILRDKVSIRKIIYPIPDEHIAFILCILSVLYMSKCCIKHVIQAFPK